MTRRRRSRNGQAAAGRSTSRPTAAPTRLRRTRTSCLCVGVLPRARSERAQLSASPALPGTPLAAADHALDFHTWRARCAAFFPSRRSRLISPGACVCVCARACVLARSVGNGGQARVRDRQRKIRERHDLRRQEAGSPKAAETRPSARGEEGQGPVQARAQGGGGFWRGARPRRPAQSHGRDRQTAHVKSRAQTCQKGFPAQRRPRAGGGAGLCRADAPRAPR